MEAAVTTSDDEAIKHILVEHSGMITKKMAGDILEKRRSNEIPLRMTIGELLSGDLPESQSVEVDARINRIFNKAVFSRDGRQRLRRSMVIGDGRHGVAVTLWDKYAEMADLMPLERGDRIHAENLRVRHGAYGVELATRPDTYIRRISPSRTCIIDFSLLAAGGRDLDVEGRVVSVGAVRRFRGLGGAEGSVSDAELTDGNISVRLVMWGSSSNMSTQMSPNDLVKAEFAYAKPSDGGLEVNAGDVSRILVKKFQNKSKVI